MPAKLDYTVGRICSQCGEQKPRADFSWRSSERRLTSRCHACRRANYHDNPDRVRERSREWYAANRDRARARDRIYRETSTSRVLVAAARKRARELSLPFDLSPDDVVIPATCPVLGIPIFIGQGHSGPNSPTLDRVIPSRGYVRGNVVVVSHRANTIKSDATLAELVMVVQFYASRDAGGES